MADQQTIYLLAAKRGDGDGTVIAALREAGQARRAVSGMGDGYDIYAVPLWESASALLWAHTQTDAATDEDGEG